MRVKDIQGEAGVGSDPSSLTALGNGKVLFNADDGVNGRELWTTDGTAAGTRLVKVVRRQML
jgi:ELWxxDGT repeat protein